MRNAHDGRSRRLRLRRPSPAMLVALLALVVATEGSAIAGASTRVAHLISGSRIKPSTITGKQIKDHTIKKNDLNASVLRGQYSASQSDLRFVKNVPGTVGQAPDAAALGGTPASSFYTKADSDARFVTKAPGTSNDASNSSNSSALQGHPASDFALKGADVTGTLTAPTIAAQSCATFDVEADGTQPGDVAVLNFVGSTTVPAGLTFQLLKVSSPDHLNLRLCNPTASPSSAVSNLGIRIIAFR